MRITRALAPVVVGGGAATVGATGWVVAERMLATPAEALARDQPDTGALVRVTTVEDGSVVLDGPGAERPGTWGLAWPGGFAQVGHVTSRGTGGARRPLRACPDTPPPGTAGWLDVNAYPDDPAAVDLPFEDVAYHSSAGRLPAWAYPSGDGQAWAVLVHGRSGTRRQGLKYVRVLHDLGISSLLIAYRGDRDAPDAGDGRNHLGSTEWQDVEGAVVWCLAAGATDLTLLGASMGGAAVLAFLRSSAHARQVRAVVLDAPVLDWPAVLRLAVRRHGTPAALAAASVSVAQGIGKVRAGIDWGLIDHLGHTKEFRHPMLIVHGDADEQVPLTASEQFARRLPSLAHLHRVQGAGHLAGWNTDPAGVEAEIAAFLESAKGAERTMAGRARQAVVRQLRRTAWISR